MARTTVGGYSTSPLDKSVDASKDGQQVRNYYSNPDAPTMKNGKAFKGAYGG